MILFLFFIVVGWLMYRNLGGVAGIAVFLGMPCLLRWQLDRELSPDAMAQYFGTPIPLIYLAAMERRPSIVRLLLEYGAKMDDWWECIQTDNVRVCQLFLALGADANAAPGGSPLIHDCRSVEMYDCLVSAGGDPYVVGPLQDTILHHGQGPKLLRHLLDRGHDPNARDKRGITPHSLAVSFGETEVIGLLHKFGGSCEESDLHAASARRSETLVGRIPVDSLDAYGRSSLHWAAACGDRKKCALLLAHGALVGLADSFGWTALHFALANDHTRVAKLLLAHVTALNELVLPRCPHLDSENIVHALTNAKSELNPPGWLRCGTPLHLAVFVRQPKLIEKMLIAGADPLAEVLGWTPRAVADALGYRDCARRLKQR